MSEISQDSVQIARPGFSQDAREERGNILYRRILYCRVTPSADELPYFQCFFVDEDEAQFPFYAFSPLQIWSFSLNPVWGLQFSQFTDNDKVTSRPALRCWNAACCSLMGLQEKTLDSKGWWVILCDGPILFLFPDLVELSYQIHAASVIPFPFYLFLFVCVCLILFKRWISWDYLNGTM